MKKAFRILHLEDNAADADIIRAELTRRGLVHQVIVAATRKDYLAALSNNEFDLILADSSIPGFGSLPALEAARQRCPGVPLIFVSGRPAPGDLSETLKVHGAAGHVLKSDLKTLVPTIQHVLETKEHLYKTNATSLVDNPTEHLIAVVQKLSLARELAAIMAIVRRAARELTGADGATFVLREKDLCYYADEDAIAPLWKGNRFPMSACISGWVMLNKQPAVIEDIYADSRIPADAYRPTFVKSLVMVPIRTANPVGAIGNYWASPHKTMPEEVKLLQALADSTSIAMENVQLYGELEQRVQERTGQLETAYKELETFSYSVSHDLRTPLRHIDAYSKLLLEKTGDHLDDDGRNYLQRICGATTRMNQLIDDLLKLSRVTLAAVSRQPADVSRMAREIVAELQAASPDRQVKVLIEEGISANGDPNLLRVVFDNLLSNAWKYTSAKPHARITVACTRGDEGRSIYSVQDNGAGFAMAYADKLFAPFQRLHSESQFPGTGVGLATVQRIIHKHGGRIWAQAKEGGGATFSFTLD